VSGSDVPMATKVIAVISGLSPTVHPKRLANSATTAVRAAMKNREMVKVVQPPYTSAGGITAKMSFQVMLT